RRVLPAPRGEPLDARASLARSRRPAGCDGRIRPASGAIVHFALRSSATSWYFSSRRFLSVLHLRFSRRRIEPPLLFFDHQQATGHPQENRRYLLPGLLYAKTMGPRRRGQLRRTG